MEEQLYVIYIEGQELGSEQTILGVVRNLEDFQKYAHRVYGVEVDPVNLKASYKYSLKKGEYNGKPYYEHYNLVAEPVNFLK